MRNEIITGFIDGDVTFEIYRSRPPMDVYKKAIDESFTFEIYRKNGRNIVTRIVGKNMFFTSVGTTGQGASCSYSWRLHLYAVGEEDETKQIFISKETDKGIFCGTWARLKDYREQENEKEKSTEEERAKSLLGLAIEQNQSIYEQIQDKDCFCRVELENIKNYLFDCYGTKTRTLRLAAEDLELFLKSEREMPDFIRSLTVDKIIVEHPQITSYNLSKEELNEVIAEAIQVFRSGKWEPTTGDYKDFIYSDIECFVKNYKEERRIAEIKARFSLEKICKMFETKILQAEQQEKLKSEIASEMEHSYIWCSEEYFLQCIEERIDSFLKCEQYEKERAAFIQMWGGTTKIIELTETKKEQFALVESGETTEEAVVNEYKLYQDLLSAYCQWIYRKGGKGIRTTFAAIPAYIENFYHILAIAQKNHILHEDGSFDNLSGFERFKKDLKKYEKSLSPNA